MIDLLIVEDIDNILDENVGHLYKDQPLAQDWARVSKVIEELGEAIAELILWTGQNPRKGTDLMAYNRMLAELADTAMTGVYAIQHFTKDINHTNAIMQAAQAKHITKLRKVR